MTSQTSILQEHLGVETVKEGKEIFFKKMFAQWNLPSTRWTSLELPYKAPNHPNLPTIDEIDQAKLDSTSRVAAYGPLKYNVCLIGNFAVKWGSYIVVQGAENLLFLQANSQARVPTVYAAYSRDETWKGRPIRLYYIVQERIDGVTLSSERWCNFRPETQEIIGARICEQLRLIRSIPSPGYYGRVHNASWGPRTPLICTHHEKSHGPYHSYEEFCTAAGTSARLRQALYPGFDVENIDSLLSRYETRLREWTNIQPTFTQMDPGLENMIVRQVLNSESEDWEVTLIDFDYAGWYPAWMQAIAFHNAGPICERAENTKFLQMMSKCCGSQESYDEQVELYNQLCNRLGYVVN